MDELFEKIIAGTIPSEKVHEDEHTYAFLDINPTAPGHTLVVPKQKSTNIFDIPESDWLAVMKTVRMLAPYIKEAMRADGLNIVMNNEPAGHQVVMHAHVHIIPRFEGDGLKPWRGRPYEEGEAQRVAEKIRSLL